MIQGSRSGSRFSGVHKPIDPPQKWASLLADLLAHELRFSASIVKGAEDPLALNQSYQEELSFRGIGTTTPPFGNAQPARLLFKYGRLDECGIHNESGARNWSFEARLPSQSISPQPLRRNRCNCWLQDLWRRRMVASRRIGHTATAMHVVVVIWRLTRRR